MPAVGFRVSICTKCRNCLSD